jgi:hypothetical protein
VVTTSLSIVALWLGTQAEVAAPAVFPTAAEAMQWLLGEGPRIISFGEYHQTKATASIRSALKRFSFEILPSLQEAGATDLVVETWITTGKCGEVEKKAVTHVEHTTERPKTTENEVLTLLRRAKASDIQPRILQVACKDYQAIFQAEELDYDKLLRLTRDQLETQIRTALDRKSSHLVLSYGGALHNDLYPKEELSPYSFGQAISKAVEGRYLEVDLVVPEYVEKDALVNGQAWFQQYRQAYQPGQVVLIEKGKGAYALVFPRTLPEPKVTAKAKKPRK